MNKKNGCGMGEVFSFQSSDLNTEHWILNTLPTLLLLLAFAPRAEAGVAATGGTMTTNGMYIVHTFTTVGSSSFNVSSGGNVEVLLVAGGGGGGYWGTQGAGGGAGGVINNTAFAVVGGSNYTVTVGAGGLGSLGHNGVNDRQATSGSNSVFGSITALGGGNGGSGGQAPGYGNGVVGSSGGSSQGYDPNNIGTPGQGNNGGAGQPNANYGQGGGGGAGANGQAGTTTYGGKGGTGLYFSAFANWGDTSHLGYFGGGGGGGYRGGTATCGGAGGWGGGGTGGNQGGSPLNNGQANTGGGGGGADWAGASSVAAGDGGSGIVIVRYVGTAMPSQMKITFGGYTNRSEVLTNFPVLVVFSHNINNSGFTFANFATTNGYDLRFGTNSKPPTIGLNYEIESWNPNGASYVWVQVPTIPTNGTGAIWANWGNTSASNQLPCTTNGAVWTNGYVGVWHMNQTNALDSTTNRFNGTAASSSATVITTAAGGMVGGCLGFGTSNGVSFNMTAAVTRVTVEAWVKHNALGRIQRYATFASESAVIRHADSSKGLHYYNTIDGTLGHCRADILSAGSWYYVAGTYDGSNQRMYNAGTQLVSNAKSGNLVAITNGYFGGPGFGEWMDGYLDEIRLSEVARSTDWLWATYLTMASNTVFNNYGAMVKQPAPKGTVFVMR